MVATSLLLGVFVLMAGCYGALFCFARLRRDRRLARAAVACYGLQAVTAALLMVTALDFWWKALLLASLAAYWPIPPLTWRFLERLHIPEEQMP